MPNRLDPAVKKARLSTVLELLGQDYSFEQIASVVHMHKASLDNFLFRCRQQYGCASTYSLMYKYFKGELD